MLAGDRRTVKLKNFELARKSEKGKTLAMTRGVGTPYYMVCCKLTSDLNLARFSYKLFLMTASRDVQRHCGHEAVSDRHLRHSYHDVAGTAVILYSDLQIINSSVGSAKIDPIISAMV